MTGPLEGGCYDAKYDDKWDAAKVFTTCSKAGRERWGGSGGGQPIDEHDWDGAQELTDEEKKELEADRRGYPSGCTGGGQDDHRGTGHRGPATATSQLARCPQGVRDHNV